MILDEEMVKLQANTVRNISSKTKICISIARQRGSFGARFHNLGYEMLGLDQVYIPLAVASESFPSIFPLLRSNFLGCSVSMPYKVATLEYLDAVDAQAAAIGAVNTIVNHDGKLTGYNTDIIGALRALEKLPLHNKSVLLLGAGGAA